jgi:tRNA pseudouridine38-40 synthase
MTHDIKTEINKQRVAIVIQYIGTNFHGWQRQHNGRSVQEEIEKVLSEIMGRPVTITGAGRTDAGVHAAAQVAHFDTAGVIPADKWAKILNSRLPQDILIRASCGVPNHWHARFSASWRRYRYILYTDSVPNLFITPFTWHYYHEPVDEVKMRCALEPLIGHHHLSAFHRANSSRNHSWVDVQDVKCEREGAFVHIEIQANGFLYGMVRLLVGLLIEVGTGKRSPENFTEIWKNERREEVKYSAPAKGLCLLRVGYPDLPLPEKFWFDTMPKFLLSH